MRKEPLTPQKLELLRGISKVTWLGFWVNLALCIFKITAGLLGNSRAVVADGVHSISDLISDVAILVGVRFWLAPADAQHPHGHQRLESLVSLFIGVLLGLAGVGIVLDAVEQMSSPREHVGSLMALAAAVISVISKEALFRWTLKKAHELQSEAVEANAWSHRSDALSSLPIVAAVAVAMWMPAWSAVDLWGAVLVALFIMHAAWQICLPSLNALLDRGAGPDLLARIATRAKEVPGVCGVHALRTRYMGKELQVDMHISVEGSLTVTEADRIAHAVTAHLRGAETETHLGVTICDVLIHIDPWDPSRKRVE